ncbi:uncharacterized protein HaLaN_25238, partial [Haematococcus lacustris]
MSLSDALHSVLEDLWNCFRTMLKTLVAAPHVILVPCLLFATSVALGCWAIVSFEMATASNLQEQAALVTQQAGQAWQASLNATYQPVKMMAHLVAENPQWQDLEARFPSWADLALKMVPDNSVRVVQLLPFGVIKAIFPNEGANKLAQDLDTFALPSRQRPLDIAASRNLTVTGPVDLVQGYTGILIQAPIFISGVGPGELFGQSKGATNCSICAFNSTYQDKFWGDVPAVTGLLPHQNADSIMAGFVQAVTDFRFILHNLAPLEQAGYEYTLMRLGSGIINTSSPATFSGALTVAQVPFGKPPREPVSAFITSATDNVGLPNGWTNKGRQAGLLVMVVVLSLLLSVMLASLLLGRYNYKELLLTILPERLFDQVTRTRSFLDKSNHWTGHYLTARAPANIILDMMSDFLEGKQPSVKDIMCARVAAPWPSTSSLHCSGTLSVHPYKT